MGSCASNTGLTNINSNIADNLTTNIKATNQAWAGSNLTFELPQANFNMYEFQAIYSTTAVQYLIVVRNDGSLYTVNVGGSACTFSYSTTTHILTITLPTNGYWVYSMTKLKASN